MFGFEAAAPLNSIGLSRNMTHCSGKQGLLYCARNSSILEAVPYIVFTWMGVLRQYLSARKSVETTQQ
jgi:hypothetical protein